jgi:hypothetical protein
MPVDTGPNLELLTIHQAIFLHSPDCEFAEVGAKSDIPYKHWFNLFKEFLMKNSTNINVKELFKWWNGRVFSFDTTKIREVKADDMESGMDEADLFLADDYFSDSEVVLSRNENNNEDFIGTFNQLTIDMQHDSNQPLPSHTVADPCASSSEPRLDSEIIILQPEKSVTQNPVGKPKPTPSTRTAGNPGGKTKAKGKQKAVFLDDAEAEALVETEDPCTTNERSLRSRRK